MAKRTAKQPESEWLVVKSFCSGGKTYEAGDSFPWRQVGCSERRLGLMVAHRMLRSAADVPRASAEKVEEE